MVIRKEYLGQLMSWKDEKIIKVVTGVRRCGKSTLFAQFKNKLIEDGINEKQIITLNFEELEYEELLDYKKLYEYIKEHLFSDGMTYVILDEIQMVNEFEKVVDSLYVKDNIDIYITGSNSYTLSSDMATFLTGRYVEIKMLPLSFNEFSEIIGNNSDSALASYMNIGGLSYVTQMNMDSEKINAYLEGIYNTVIVKDIEERQNRKLNGRDVKKVSDITLLKTIAKFLANSIGSPISVKSVTNYLTSNGRKVSANTVDDYIDALCESFIFYPADRYDISGKELLKNNRKLYIVDLGLRNYILPKSRYDLGFSIENVVYFELLRRGYRVNVGKIGKTEVDFVARRGDEIIYYQVTADMTSDETFDREMRPLRAIKDNYEKIVLTLDKFTIGNYEGIKVINVKDWLLGEAGK